MKTYYTKCGRQFKKSSTAEVTGYHIDLREDGTISEVYQILKKEMLDNLQTCVKCPFRVKVTKGWPPQFDRWECRAGSEPPNHKTEWAGSLDDKNTIRIHSLDHSFMEKIRQFCVDHPELGASYLADNMADCRRTLSISCSANKKGIAAKKELIKKFFPDKERTPVKAVEKAMGIENYKRGILSGLEKMKNNNIEERVGSQNTVLEIVDSKEIQPFDYSTVDEDTAVFLQEKANRIVEIRIKAHIALGKEFKETQERLANHYQGSFQQWVKSLGITPKTAYNYINGYEYVVKNFHNIEDAEKIQPSLLFAISKPSALPELQEAVISGDITTHKQYKDLEEKLKAAQKEASEAKAEAETERNAWRRINESYDRLEKVNHEHYEKARELEKELKAAKEQLLEAQSSGDNEEVERLKQLLQNTEDELEESKQRIEELELESESGSGDSSNEIVTAVVDKIPDEVMEELAELRSRSESIEASAEVKILVKELNNNILNLGKKLSTVEYKDMATIMKYRSYIEPIKESMILLKKVSLENLETDIFDFIKD